MSMDFVYDLTEKLQEQKIDYLLVTVRKGNKNDTADVFYFLQDNDSIDSMTKAVEDSYYFIQKEKDEDAKTPPRKNLKKPPKRPKRPPSGKDYKKRRGGEDDKK